jgi:hypothetical protein
MDFILNITEKNATFKQKVYLAICEELTLKFFLISNKIREDIVIGIEPFFKNTEQYKMLVSDEHTMADLGFRVGSVKNMINNIINKICKNIKVSFTPFLPKINSISGGINIGILIKDYSDILEMSEAHIITEKGFNINWLEWVLIEGDAIQFMDYHMEYGPYGRSGKGHMIKNTDGSVSLTGSWRLQEPLRGSVSDNWLTQALLNNKTEIEKLIETSLKTHLH